MTETISEIKEYLKKQKNKWDYIFHFSEEIDAITDPDIILQIANIVKIKHQELLKKNNKNKTLIHPAKQPAEQPTMDVFRAKNQPESNLHKNDETLMFNAKQCYKCKEWKSKELFYTCKTNKDGLQAYCKDCQKKITKENKKNNVKKARKLINKKIVFNKKESKGVFIPTYQAVIHIEEIDKVLEAIKKDYSAVSYSGTHNDFICSETGIMKWRVNAVLFYLRGLGRINKDFSSGKLRYVVV